MDPSLAPPLPRLSIDTSFKFKNIFSNVSDVLLPDSGSKKGLHLKILADVNLNKPLPRGTKLQYADQEVWVEFKYENMAAFCYYCGFVGHTEKLCSKRKGNSRSGQLLEGQYGEWLKADSNRSHFRKPPTPDMSSHTPPQSPL